MPWSAFHEIDVLDRNRTAVSEIGNEYCKSDGGLCGRDRQHHQRKYLTYEVTKKCGKCHKVDVDRQQDQFDGHQNNDHVFPIEEYSEYPEREQDCCDREIVTKPDDHGRPCPDLTLTISMALDLVRATWSPGS